MREENELIELRVAVSDYSINKNLYSSVSYFSIAVILGIAGYFLTDIFAASPNISLFELIQYALYVLSGLFGTVGIVFGIRAMASSSKTEYERLSELYKRKQAEKETMQNEMLEIRNNIDAIELKIKNLKDKLAGVKNDIQNNTQKLITPFFISQ
jgi:peptidoglycan hydrolase CwlO-like protein